MTYHILHDHTHKPITTNDGKPYEFDTYHDAHSHMYTLLDRTKPHEGLPYMVCLREDGIYIHEYYYKYEIGTGAVDEYESNYLMVEHKGDYDTGFTDIGLTNPRDNDVLDMLERFQLSQELENTFYHDDDQLIDMDAIEAEMKKHTHLRFLPYPDM